ncbi:MAG: CRISPR-associated endonuclease Cas1 [Methanoregula sp.]|nr:CRISPR-associated endonuclease Cas1 [Methanoregula sp.]
MGARGNGEGKKQIQKVIPEDLEFSSRCVGRMNRPIGASDAVNCMLNYGYGLLEAECLRAINASGLDAHVGFLHEMAPGKYSLAYDMQELFRRHSLNSGTNPPNSGTHNLKNFRMSPVWLDSA